MKPPSRACAFPLLGCVLAAPAAAQARWSQTPTTLAPSARQNHAASYDVGRRRLVVFGGESSGGVRINDTWELAGATWVPRLPAQSPPARVGHWMAYDPGRARLVLFGGSTNGSSLGSLGDTWEWDGTTWTQRLPAQAPPARWLHAMAADWIHLRVVLFGGQDSTGVHRNDTWAWDGTNWTQPASTGPTPRSGFDLVQDIVRGRIVLFGGSAQVTLGDTWEFDGLAWQQMQPLVAPTARLGHRMSYDPMHDLLILNGGISGSAETWKWDGVTWTLLDASLARINHTIHHDWQIGRAVLFGGSVPQVGGPPNSTTWTFGTAASATVAPFGSACPGPMGTPQLGPYGTSRPSIGYSMVLRAAPVSAIALFLSGWSNAASGSLTLPYSLAPHGAPGCSVLVSTDAVFGVAAWPGSLATMWIPVPFAPSLVGTQFFNQAVSFDPGANPLGLTTSNGLRSTIGW